MIREITPEEIEDIRPIFNRIREKLSDIPENFLDRIKESVSTDKASLYANYDDGGSVNGVALFGKVSSRFSIIFADGNLELEKDGFFLSLSMLQGQKDQNSILQSPGKKLILSAGQIQMEASHATGIY